MTKESSHWRARRLRELVTSRRGLNKTVNLAHESHKPQARDTTVLRSLQVRAYFLSYLMLPTIVDLVGKGMTGSRT